MAGDKLLEMWNRGDTDMESQPRKKLSHSIEEILRRPTCVRREKRVNRNWSVIKENTRISNQLSCAGTFLLLLFLKALPKRVVKLQKKKNFSLSIETPQMRLLEESPKATTDCMSEYYDLWR